MIAYLFVSVYTRVSYFLDWIANNTISCGIIQNSLVESNHTIIPNNQTIMPNNHTITPKNHTIISKNIQSLFILFFLLIFQFIFLF